MSSFTIRSEYDKLESNAKRFSKSSNQVQRSLSKLKQALSEIEGGGWVGQAAKAFIAEMSDEVVPALERLVEWLEQGSTTTNQVLKLFREAESVWMRIFRILAETGAVGVGVGAGAGGGGAAGVGAAAGGGGATAASSWQMNALLVRNPQELFTDSNFDNLVGSEIQGTGPELGAVMNELLDNPSPGRTNELIIELSIIRGRPAAELQAEFEKFQEVQEQQAQNNPDGTEGLIGGSSNSHMGSLTQMRYGSVVGDAFGIDPAFGAMLNPTGGLVGWGPLGVDAGGTAVGYHGIVHDAAGYLYTNHNVGPGYDYLGTGGRGQPGSPLSGQANGIAYWRGKVGSDVYSSTAEYAMREGVGGLDRASSFFDQVGSFF